MHHAALYRAGTHDGDFDYQIVKLFGPQSRQHGHLRARFDLEHADGVGALDHFIHSGIVAAIQNILQGERRPTQAADKIKRAAYCGEHAECEHIDFKQPQRFEVVFVPLNNAALRHGSVFDRHKASQRTLRNDKTTDMLRQMTRKIYD